MHLCLMLWHTFYLKKSKYMEFKFLNGIKTYAPKSSKQLIQYIIQNKKALVAINAEKILNSNILMRDFINKNIGYPDGIGAVWALKKKGINNSY